MKVKGESEKVGLKLNIQKTKIMASGTITILCQNSSAKKNFQFQLALSVLPTETVLAFIHAN